MSAEVKIQEVNLSLDEPMVGIITKAVTETFSSFMGITPSLEYSEKTKKILSEPYEISGIISFIQEAVEGTLAIRFKQKSILKLLSLVYGEELSALDSRVIGGVAELSNVIHSIVKEDLNLQGYQYQMCLPVVIIGNNHSVVTALSGEKLILKYLLGDEELIVELVLYKQ